MQNKSIGGKRNLYFNERKLVSGKPYGTKAKDIYIQCCNLFGWDKIKSSEFGMMKPLYGHKVTDKGTKYVWFICKCNWYNDLLIEDENGIKHHRNFIHTSSDGKVLSIDEYQQNAPYDGIAYPLRDRITFAKNKQGQYVFLGIFRSNEPLSRRCDRTFYRISDNYFCK